MFSQKGFFKISIKREKYFKEHNRIRIASIYPHTCTSWFDCMIFSMDPLFDLAKYAIQVCLQTFPTWAPHNLFRSRKKKKAKTQNALVRKQTLWGIWEYHLRNACELCFISKKSLQVTKMGKWNEMAMFQSCSISQPLKKIC